MHQILGTELLFSPTLPRGHTKNSFKMAKFAVCKTFQLSPLATNSSSFQNSSVPLFRYPFSCFSKPTYVLHSKKKKSQLEPPVIEEVATGEEGEQQYGSADEYEDDGTLTDAGDFLEDEYDPEESELIVGDGAGGGGISLAGTSWDKKALSIAEDTLLSFNGDLKIYAFKTLPNSTIQIRIEKLSNRSGSPSMADIQDFSSAYRARLDEAELDGSIPENLSLEVSSPGVERVVQIPQDLDRFKDRPMYVKYISEETETGLSTESDGVFRLVSFDLEFSCCTWGLADVKINREKAGKGRPMNKKQREWRLNTPFQSLRLVRIHSEI